MIDDGPADPAGGAPRGSRAHLRVPIDVFVRVVGADRDYPFRTRDVSEGGIYLATRVGHLYPFSLGDRLVIELHDGNEVVAAHGEIVRVVAPDSPEAARHPAGFGVRLVGVSAEDRAKLRTVLARHGG